MMNTIAFLKLHIIGIKGRLLYLDSGKMSLIVLKQDFSLRHHRLTDKRVRHIE